MVGLIVSIIALTVGPVIYILVRHHKEKIVWINGVVIASLAFVIIDHASGEHAKNIGISTALAFVIGLGLPFLFEIAAKYGLAYYIERQTHKSILIFVAVMLCFHAIADGIALRSGGIELTAAISLHRLPVGAALWSLMKENYLRIISFLGIAFSTVLGFYFIEIVVLDESIILMIEAFVIGSLTHVLFFSHGDHNEDHARL